ncbi:MAG TPA: GlsB/YeaQ/YmgE family stress response membrane protein [Anaerolinea sp.]|nr:GlsB/YeaQ/YmgE family stress response membrane protein [Anaerolinea sp.]
MNFLVWIISGVIAGWLAGLIVKGKGFGLIGDLVVGLVGGLIGGWLAGLVGIQATNWLGNILVAALGGVVLVAIVRLIRRA